LGAANTILLDSLAADAIMINNSVCNSMHQ